MASVHRITAQRIIGIGILATAAATALAAVSPAMLSVLDLRIFDAMLRVVRTEPPSDRVAIVAVDDRSLTEIGQWPWPRHVIARLIDRIHERGARAIAIDLLLAEPDRLDRTNPGGAGLADSALGQAAAERPVVIGYAFTFGPPDATGRRCVIHPIHPAIVERAGGRSPVDELFHATGVVCSLPMFSLAAGASGYLNAAPDRDGLLRRIPLIMEFDGAIYPSLALATVARANGIRRISVDALPGGRSRIRLDDVEVPLDARGTMYIRFRGGHGTHPAIAAADVLNGRAPAELLRDRIVFVGSTALGVQDLVSTPRDIAMPGIEVHAMAADTLIRTDFVATPSYWRAYELLSTAGFGLAVALFVAAVGLGYGAIAATVLISLLWWGTFLALSTRGILLSPVFPTIGGLFPLAVLTVAKARHERLRAEVEQARREQAHRFVLQSLTTLVEARDGVTGLHARRTEAYARLLAERLATHPRFKPELTRERIRLISQLSSLHDIGKVGVRDAVLNKPGALSADEWDEMRRHPEFGHTTIERADRNAGGHGDELFVQIAKEIIYTHHERWDGGGYPRGLKGEEIPVAGRIMAVVDVYDALSNRRSYRAGVSHEEAVATIAAERGTQFDPDVVDAFLALSEEFRALSQVSVTL